jgi:autotransporter-associated beta strand protein
MRRPIPNQLKMMMLFLAILALIGVQKADAQTQTLIHPGIAFNRSDLDQLKANITKEPWLSTYNEFRNDGRSQLSYGMKGPAATVSRSPDLNNNSWKQDMMAIHNLAFMWWFTGDSTYARKATNMLDAWAVTNIAWEGTESFLDIGDYAQYWGTGAEILRYTFPGWTAANTQHVEKYFSQVLFPTSWVPIGLSDQNKGALQLKIALAASIFCNDVTRFNQSIEVYRMDAGGGMRNSLPNGEVGDTGRDDHWRGQATALVWGAEVAYKQRVDMFAELDNRVLAIAELYHKYAFDGATMTYIPFGGYASYWTNWGIQPGSRNGEMTNIIQNAYTRRKGIPTPHTDRMRAAIMQPGATSYSPTGGDFLFLKSSDTATAVTLPPVFYPAEHVLPVSNLTNIDIGNTGMAGSSSFDNGIWTIKSAGTSTSDAFSFNFKKVSGDAGLVVKVDNMSLTNGGSGVMLRESLMPGSRYWDIYLGANGGAGRHPQPKAPWWLKIERVGTRIFTYHSQDGVNWTNLGSSYSATGFPTILYAGFYTVSNSTSAQSIATFSNVAYSQSAPTGSPEISSATTATAKIGEPFNYSIIASGSPSGYSASSLPAGLSLDAPTGIISGIPTELGQSEVTLTATNTSGSGTATLILKVLNNQAPVAPATASASTVNGTQIRLSWAASASATSYSVKRSLTAGGPYTTIQTGITSTSFTDVTPVLEVNNYYIITALTGDMESANSNEVFASVPPAVPGRPVASNQSDRINLTWDAVNGATSYNVKRGTISGGPYTTIATVSTTSYTDTNVSSGSPYYYVLSSVGVTKESANSPESFGVPGASSSIWSPTPLSNSLSLAANWVENTFPVNPAILTFSSTTDSGLTNDLTNLVASRIQFEAGANAYTFSGNALTLKNDLVNNSSNIQTFNTPLVLTEQLNVNLTANTVLQGNISGIGSLLKTGAGTLYIKGNNNAYSGNTTLVWGAISAGGSGTGTSGNPISGPLGTGKILMNGGALHATALMTLDLYNDIEVLNSGYMYEDENSINLHGRLLGPGTLTHDANGFAGLNLYGDNSEFTGKFISKQRSDKQRVRFQIPNSGSAKAFWLLDANGVDCHGIRFPTGTLHFGALSGRGYIRNNAGGAPVVSIGALNIDTDFGGTFDGYILIEKVGTGKLVFWGNNNYGGTTTIKNGKFFVSNDPIKGVFQSPIIVEKGTFGGSGKSTASATIGTGGGSGAFLEPGNNDIDDRLSIAALTMKADATYKAELNLGTAKGDKIIVTSTTLLNSPVLSISSIAGTLPSGTAYTLIDNTGTNPINGTFKDLPEMALISVGGYNFRITYKGGDGNDVVIFDNRSVVAITASKDTAFSYTLTAENNPTSFNITGLPQGLSLNTSTGQITGTPSESGIFILKVQATGSTSTAKIIVELTVKPNAVPSVPVLQAKVFNAFQADLTWDTLPASSLVSGYTVKRSETAGGPYAKIAEGIKNNVYSNKGLNAETAYYYVLSASNEIGESANSGEVSVTTPAPSISPMVRGLIAVGGNARVNINWQEAFEALTYNVKRSLTAMGPFMTITNLSGTTFTDINVSNGITYYYVITGVNPAGESVPSTVATAAPGTATFAYWPFNEAAGTSAIDIWNSKQVLLEGPNVGWDKGISGSGLKLGENSYATLPAGAVSTLTNFTVATWVKLDETKAWERVFDFGSGTDNYMFLTTNGGGGVRYAIKVNGGNEQVLGAPYKIPVGEWVHLAVTLNGTTGVLYVDGKEIARNENLTSNPSMLGNTTQTWIGKSQWPDPLMKGMVDDFRIYSRGLNATEIALMQQNKPEGTPEITSATNATALLDRDFGYAITATHSPYSYKASGLPAGLSLNMVTGVISGKPTQAGTFLVNLTASNSSNEGKATLTLKIQSSVVSNLLVASGDAKNILEWDPILNFNYNVKRATTSGGPYTTVGTVSGTTFTDTNVSNGSTYYYVVSSVDSIGANPNSAEVKATPTIGQVTYLKFDEASGMRVIDSWGAKHATLATTADRSVGKDGQALKLDGTTTAYATLPIDLVSALSDYTVSSWVKMDALGNWMRIFDFGTGRDKYMFFTVQAGTAGQVRFGIKNGGTEQGLSYNYAVPLNVWTHFAITQSGNTCSMYINGALVATNTGVTIKPSTIGSMNLNYLGKSNYIENDMFKGAIDEFKIYNRALSASEISSAYLSQTITLNPISPKLMGDGDFDPGAVATSGLPIIYASSDTTVAKIVNGKIKILTVGTSTITASQTGNNMYWPVTSQSKVLTVAITNNTQLTTLIGKPFTYTITDRPLSNFSATGLPSGLVLNAVTGVISGTPTAFGNFPVTLTASNGSSTGSQTISLTVQNIVVSNIVVAAGDAKNIIEWDAVQNFSYNVKRSATSGGPYTTIANVGTTRFTDTNISNGTSYYYVVASVDSIGEMPSSAEVVATPNTGQVSYLKFDEASGIRVIDSWGATHGTLAATAGRDVGKYGQALKLDGTANAYATLPTGIVSALNDFTISTWLKMDAKTNWMRVFDFGTGTTKYMFLSIQAGSANVMRYAIKNGGAEQVVSYNYTLPLNTWTHFAITQSGNTCTMYINGTAVASNTGLTIKPSAIGSTTQNYLGRSQFNDPLLKGSIDEFKLYSRALTAAEIAQNMKSAQNIIFNSIAEKGLGGADFDPFATTTSGLPVTYVSSDLSVATIVDGKIHIVAAGTSNITASQAGNTDYTAAQPISQVLTVKNVQTISFPVIASKVTGDIDFDAGATASSGLTLSYNSLDPNVATVVDGKLHILTAGTTTITASQVGNAQYLAATPVSQVLTVKNVQTINFVAIAPKVLGDADFTLEASATSGIPVSFSSADENVATVINGTVHILKAGTTVFTASQPGNETYNAASVTQNLTILPLNLKVLSADGDNGQQSNNVIKPKLKIVNGDTTSTSYSILTARYWFTAENFAGINTWIDYAQMGNSKVKTKYVALPQPRNDAYGYIEYSFDATAGALTAGASSGIIESGLANSNWANLTESNDFSYRTGSTYADNSKITLYRNGTLIWGTEPEPVNATKSVKVFTESKNAGNSTISTYLKVENTGNTPVDYKDISIRYFFTPESAAGLNFWVDYANLGASKIQGQFVAINPSLSTNGGAYLELKVDSSAGKLYPLSETGNIQYRIAKSDWSTFNQLNDHSYQPGNFAENNHVCVYYRGELIYGTVPAGTNNQLAIAAPKESNTNLPSSTVIYPNPVTNNRFNITTTANLLKKVVEVKLIDLTGRTVYSKSAFNNSGNIEVQLQRQVSAGVYVLLLNNQYAGKVLIN